jgi:hypothetical protein
MDPRPSQMPTKRELTSREKETVQSFEELPFKTLTQKVELILVWRKLKRGTQIILSPEITDINLKIMIKIIEKAGLFCKIAEDKDSKNPRKACFIANNQEVLESLSNLFFGDHLNSSVCLELGKIYGFPKTAIEAFKKNHNSMININNNKDEFFLTWEEVEEKIPKDLQPFIGFKFSKDHWEEELKILEKWAEEIKLVSPELYKLKIQSV